MIYTYLYFIIQHYISDVPVLINVSFLNVKTLKSFLLSFLDSIVHNFLLCFLCSMDYDYFNYFVFISKNPEFYCFLLSHKQIVFFKNPLSYFSFQPVFQDCCNKGHGVYCPVCGMVRTKYPLLLNRKSSPNSGIPLSLSE